jgi:zinc D-Ala-D-Ala carboxypeptidase
MKISEFLTYEEAIASKTAKEKGIDNSPTPEHLLNMKHVAENVFDPVRRFVNGPLYASSFYRSAKLNNAVAGSSKTSQHMKGEAIDIDCDHYGNGTNHDIFKFIISKLAFDQLIMEYPDALGRPSWVHVSLRRDGNNRREVLVKLKDKYIPYSTYRIGMV